MSGIIVKPYEGRSFWGFIFDTDVRTDSSTKSDGWSNTGVIAGVAAVLVLLLALILVALYIHSHAAAPRLHFIQVSIECERHLP